ncbi:GOLPH3/VPS74 family protein [Prauserella rugosa]|uniref:Golgi phosphoprotein 3 GPP34 n=1 Tax=Prauserella rugosa TaxID=43354 RepID=A0A660C9J9_9PSEU|nr:GPP34 family phosphoprotein [Prauserella rugosa]KMS82266.1 phosphoprotein 3 (GPP34) [Streptomyces regensis]TWH20132.1 Golgi phosphoprotein 3 GPP34 [Prauserella rugosa]
MLIAEDLLLLAFDDTEGKPVSGIENLDQAVAGALLLELTLLGKVDVTGEADGGKAGRIVVRDATPVGNTELDAALAVLDGEQGAKPQDAVARLAKDDPVDRLLSGLADRGVLRRESRKVLKLFPVTRWPAADSRHEEQLRAELHRVLDEGGEPDDRTAAVIALLVATKSVEHALPTDDPKATRKRAEQIAEGNWGGDAVRKAVDEITAAVMVAVMAAVVITTS